jgi:hypothetical protein
MVSARRSHASFVAMFATAFRGGASDTKILKQKLQIFFANKFYYGRM